MTRTETVLIQKLNIVFTAEKVRIAILLLKKQIQTEIITAVYY